MLGRFRLSERDVSFTHAVFSCALSGLSRDEHDWISSDLLLQTSEALATLDGTMLIFETSRRNGVSKG